MRDAKLSFSDLDEVILVGGSTRIPAVQELVRRVTGKEPNVTVNPDEVVALGAAVQVNPPLLSCYYLWLSCVNPLPVLVFRASPVTIHFLGALMHG